MTIPFKVLSKENIEWARSGPSNREVAAALGIGRDRAGRIKKAPTLEAAMAYCGAEDVPETPTGAVVGSAGSTTVPAGGKGNLPPSKTPVQITSRTLLEIDVAKAKLQLYPEDVMRCLDEYRDLQELAGWQGDFSSTLREGMKLLRSVTCHIVNEKGGKNGEKGRSDGHGEDSGVAASATG